jgi:hydrogenase expression/formation protein HypC
VLAHNGSALRVLSEQEAQQTSAALAALDAVLSGTQDLDTYFADLTTREPQLPPHLRKPPKETPQ